jgi:hypothetical protein
LINRRQQGDLGEASAIEWLTRQRAVVLIPFGHSPDYDLVADVDGRLLRIQVKTSTYVEVAANGFGRYQVHIATNGGNQSWTGVAKRFDPRRADYVFALVGDGRRWLIPAGEIDGSTNITLGGLKYSEYEIEPGWPIAELVFGEGASVESDGAEGEYPSGQRMRSVKPSAYCLRRFESCLPHASATSAEPRFRPSKYERQAGKRGEAVINQKRRVTLSQQALLTAGLRDGDRVRVRADRPGRIVLEKAGLPVWAEQD